MEILKSGPKHFSMIEQFYKTKLPAGYSLSPTDSFFIAHENGEVVGCVRLVRENGTLVLRAMQVKAEMQRSGIGALLLKLLSEEVGQEQCYCIPFAHLENFYGQIGFRKIDDSVAPLFLRDRLQRYKLDDSYILMRKN
jgi:N-acetylglutamate synthase-like GNAT family acetyltransferase